MRTALYLLAGISLAVPAAAAAPNDIERMQSDIELRVANQQFMGTVLVAKGDRLLINRGYGCADLEWNTPNTPDTRFPIGSVTKQFTAASILLLQERGKLRVEAPLKTYLPDTPPVWSDVTIFNLLTHTSGIPDFIRLADFRNFLTLPLLPEQLIAKIRGKPLDFAPGSDRTYSNSGYLLLGLVIEKLSGESYARFVKENLLDPAGMRDSGYDTHAAVIHHRASGYTRAPDGFENAPYVDMSIPFAAGGLYSTTGDLLRWEQALFGGKILSRASLEQMTTPFKQNYGFGVVIRQLEGDKIVDHSGSLYGFNSELIHGARDNLVVVVLSNVSGPMADQLADDLFKVAHGDQVELTSDRKVIHLAAATLERYEGYYEFPDGDVTRVWRDGGRFLTQLQAEPAVEFFAQSRARVLREGRRCADHLQGTRWSCSGVRPAPERQGPAGDASGGCSRQTEIRRTRRAGQESNAGTRHRERAAWEYRRDAGGDSRVCTDVPGARAGRSCEADVRPLSAEVIGGGAIGAVRVGEPGRG